MTWIVNTTPHVITESQIDELKGLLSEAVKEAGGNSRGTTGSNEQQDGLPPSQRVWKFSQTSVIDVPPLVQAELDVLWHEYTESGFGTIKKTQEMYQSGAQAVAAQFITSFLLLAISVII